MNIPDAQTLEKLGLDQEQLLYIDGENVPASGGYTFVSYNPATGKPLTNIADGRPEDLDSAIQAAMREFGTGEWPLMPASDRGRILVRVAEAIRGRKDELAHLESLDVGKPLRMAYADVEATARYFEFYGGMADKIGGTTIPLGEHVLDVVLREPIGVSGQILPFNYSLQNTGRGAAPALAAGCTVVLKPSEVTSVTPARIARIANECGVPDGVFNVVMGGREIGAELSSHPSINQVTFTGSVATGIKVAQSAAQNVVPSTLELGGKSPTIVFGDADRERAIPAIIGSIFTFNAGQICAAGSRLLLQRGEEGDTFLEELKSAAAELKLGAGTENPDVGPLVSEAQRDKVLGFLSRATEDGGVVHLGGAAPQDQKLKDGYFIQPSIIEVSSNKHPLAQHEIFGPVLTVVRFDTPQEAAAIANDTDFGLSSYVWTRDMDRALYLATKIRAGQVNVNSYKAGTGIEMPFGGYKYSGWGREKGIEGLNSYLVTKNINMGIEVK